MGPAFPWLDLWYEMIFALAIWTPIILMELLMPSVLHRILRGQSADADRRVKKLKARLKEVEAEVEELKEKIVRLEQLVGERHGG